MNKERRIVSKKITDSARGRACLVGISEVCNGNPETTVFAHLNGAGMGTKHSDLFGAYACSNCHSVLDGQTKLGYHAPLDIYFLRAVIKTQTILLREGLIKLAGAK